MGKCSTGKATARNTYQIPNGAWAGRSLRVRRAPLVLFERSWSLFYSQNITARVWSEEEWLVSWTMFEPHSLIYKLYIKF